MIFGFLKNIIKTTPPNNNPTQPTWDLVPAPFSLHYSHCWHKYDRYILSLIPRRDNVCARSNHFFFRISFDLFLHSQYVVVCASQDHPLAGNSLWLHTIAILNLGHHSPQTVFRSILGWFGFRRTTFPTRRWLFMCEFEPEICIDKHHTKHDSRFCLCSPRIYQTLKVHKIRSKFAATIQRIMISSSDANERAAKTKNHRWMRINWPQLKPLCYYFWAYSPRLGAIILQEHVHARVAFTTTTTTTSTAIKTV